jgi:L-lactate permease
VDGVGPPAIESIELVVIILDPIHILDALTKSEAIETMSSGFRCLTTVRRVQLSIAGYSSGGFIEITAGFCGHREQKGPLLLDQRRSPCRLSRPALLRLHPGETDARLPR